MVNLSGHSQNRPPILILFLMVKVIKKTTQVDTTRKTNTDFTWKIQTKKPPVLRDITVMELVNGTKKWHIRQCQLQPHALSFQEKTPDTLLPLHSLQMSIVDVFQAWIYLLFLA